MQKVHQTPLQQPNKENATLDIVWNDEFPETIKFVLAERSGVRTRADGPIIMEALPDIIRFLQARWNEYQRRLRPATQGMVDEGNGDDSTDPGSED